MNDRELTMPHWNRLSESAQASLAGRIARGLSERFRFLGLRAMALGGQHYTTAFFAFDNAEFAFVPGGEVELGFDAQRRFKPSEEQQSFWDKTWDQYEHPSDIFEYVDSLTGPERTAIVEPLLVETRSWEVGPEPIPLDDPLVQQHKSLKEAAKGPRYAVCEVYRVARVAWDSTGNPMAYRINRQTHDQLRQKLVEHGFRLLSSDEWEHCCGAGAKSLFRWGDHCPCDRYAADINPENPAAREFPDLPPWEPSQVFDLHLRPNAYGLSIASNPYHWEIVNEPDVRRGGDGGCSTCGGEGAFAGWLPLATAYHNPRLFAELVDVIEGEGQDPSEVTDCYVRRALPLR